MDHRRVSVMPHCIGLEGRAAIDSAGASHGVIVWSAGRSRKLRENQLSKVQDSAAKRVTAKVDRYQLICLNSGNARPAPLHMWQDVSSQDVLENLLAHYCAGAAHDMGVNPDTVNRGGHRQTAQTLWTAFRQRVPSAPQEWAKTLKRRRLLI